MQTTTHELRSVGVESRLSAPTDVFFPDLSRSALSPEKKNLF